MGGRGGGLRPWGGGGRGRSSAMTGGCWPAGRRGQQAVVSQQLVLNQQVNSAVPTEELVS